MELRNAEIQQKAIAILGAQTFKILQELKDKMNSGEWPESLTQETINVVIKTYTTSIGSKDYSDTRKKIISKLKNFFFELAKHKNIGAEAQQFITDLDQEYLDFLSEIGLKNVEIRQKAIVKLNDQTASMLAELKEKTDSEEWPEVLANESVTAILRAHSNFFKKLIKG